MIANGKYMEAISWAKETAGYVEKKWGTPPVSVFIDSFSAMGVVRWTTDYADLAALEKVQNQMMLDQGYWQLVEKAFKGGLFIDASRLI